MRHPDRRLRIWIGGALVVLIACWQFFGAVDSRPMHRDEARWIHRAVYIRELLHPFSDYWNEQTWIEQGGTLDERYRLRAQPPMGSYVMGLGFLLQGKLLPNIGFWNMDQDDAWNAEHGNEPSPDQITTGRRTSAAVSVLTVLAIYLVVTRLTNVVGGVVAGLMLAFNPLMIYLATFAGSDAVLGLTIALAAVAAYRLADRPTWLRTILLGLAIAAGGSTKLSPLGIVVPLGLLGLAGLTHRFIRHHAGDHVPPGPSLRLCLQLITIPAIAGFGFIASYPWLWRHPIANTRALVEYRQWGMDIQGMLWQQVAVENRIDAFRRIGIKLGQEWTTLGRLGWSWLPDGLELA
ncbi:MAG TPA: glycosyltransferase family 39 protein, partial [Thermomicrobiales bacterium]|nr:glycosyltransferase family 39 protein [Thermomicrobiales bacterium]